MNNVRSNTNKTTVVARIKQAIVGVNKYLGAQPSLLLGGVQFTPAALVALFQSFVALDDAVMTAKGKARDLMQQQRILRAQILGVLKALHALVNGTYGDRAAEILGDFGFAPAKAPKTKVKVKAAALDKSLATRAARHTMGTKQKKAVTGTPVAAATPPKA